MLKCSCNCSVAPSDKTMLSHNAIIGFFLQFVQPKQSECIMALNTHRLQYIHRLNAMVIILLSYQFLH